MSSQSLIQSPSYVLLNGIQSKGSLICLGATQDNEPDCSIPRICFNNSNRFIRKPKHWSYVGSGWCVWSFGASNLIQFTCFDYDQCHLCLCVELHSDLTYRFVARTPTSRWRGSFVWTMGPRQLDDPNWALTFHKT